MQDLQTENINHQQIYVKQPYLFQTETKRLKLFYSQPDKISSLLRKRIIFNNSIGTVAYVGQLRHNGRPQNSQGQIWVGIEWDQANRGKHNGTVNGYQYFQCDNNKGSLVKFQKIQFGYKLQTALFKRYFKMEEMHHAKDIYEALKEYKKQLGNVTEEEKQKKCHDLVKKKVHKTEYDAEAYVETLNKDKKILVEFIGFDEIWSKLNNLEKLYSISLAECRICDLGPINHVSGILTNLKILSLEDNLISSWEQVFQLGFQLKSLSQLSLTNNKIAQPTFNCVTELDKVHLYDHGQFYEIENYPRIFNNLRCLILINTGLTWKTLFKISRAFSQTINQLILCKNDLSDIDNIDEKKVKQMKELSFLNVQECNLKTFQGINAFRNLKKLEKLILNRNPIKELGKVEGFDNLKQLSVQYCEINDAVVIYQISRFSELESLNIKHNPVGDRMGNSHVRMRSVAEILKLKVINGSMLKKYERKDCEIYYLRESFKQYFALRNVKDYNYDFKDFLQYCSVHHPGMEYFIKKYGNPYEVEDKKQIQEIIKDEVKQIEMKKGTGMIQVTILNTETGTAEIKKMPLTWTVSTLKNFFSKLHKIPVGNQLVKCQSDQNSAQQEMTEDHKTISFYNLMNGSKMILSRKL